MIRQHLIKGYPTVPTVGVVIGVYKIKCLTTGKFYIGSSDNIRKRMRRHFYDLRKNKHGNVLLQRSFNKYGEASFCFYFVKSVPTIIEARKLEQLLLDRYYSNPRSMNIGSIATGGDNYTNNPNKDKIKEKLLSTLDTFRKSMSPETRDKFYKRYGSDNGMFGNTHTLKVRQLLSRYHTGNTYALGAKHSLESREKQSRKIKIRINSSDYVNPFKGKSHSQETKDKIASKMRGKIPINARKVKIGDTIYTTASEAARDLGVVTATILFRIKSKNFQEYSYI